MPLTYFSSVNPYYHSEYCNSPGIDENVCMFSFAMEANRHQPTGTLNFSRVDNAKLVWEAASSPIYLYAVNYNIFRIESGLGGVRFSN